MEPERLGELPQQWEGGRLREGQHRVGCPVAALEGRSRRRCLPPEMLLAKYQKLGSINNRNLFLRVPETERPQIKSPADSEMRKSIIDQVLLLCLNIVRSAS